MTPEQELLYNEIVDRGELSMQEALDELPIFQKAANAKDKIRFSLRYLVDCGLATRSGRGKYAPVTKISPLVPPGIKNSVSTAKAP